MVSDKSYATEARLAALINQAGPVPATISVPNITTTGNAEIAHYTIPALTIKGTERYEGIALHTVSTGGTAPTGMTWTIYADGVGSGILAQLAVPAAGLIASLNAAGCTVEFDTFWLSSSEAWTSLRLWWRTATGVGGSQAYHTHGSLTGIDTTVAKSLTLAFGFTGTGLTLVTRGAHIHRVA